MSGDSFLFHRFCNDRYVNHFAQLQSDCCRVIFVGRQVAVTRLKNVFRFCQGATRAFCRLFPCRSNVPQDSTDRGCGTADLRRAFLVVGGHQRCCFVAIHVSTSARAIIGAVKLFRCLLRRRVQMSSFLRLSRVRFRHACFKVLGRIIRVSSFRYLISTGRHCLPVLRVRRFVHVLCGQDDVQDRGRFVLPCPCRRQATFANYGGLVKVVLIGRHCNMYAGRLVRDRLGNDGWVWVIKGLRGFG